MVLQKLCPERVWSPTGCNMNPKGHNRLLRTNEAWLQEKMFSYDMGFHGIHVSLGDLHGIHVSYGWHPWDTCIPWISTMGYMEPMDEIPNLHRHLGVKLGSIFLTFQGPSRGLFWVSIKGPMGFPGSIQQQFWVKFWLIRESSGDPPGSLPGPPGGLPRPFRGRSKKLKI